MRDVLNLLAYGLIMFALIFGSILFYNAVAINFSIELIKNDICSWMFLSNLLQRYFEISAVFAIRCEELYKFI